MSLLKIEKNRVTIDGEPFRLLSGDIHYFRVYPGGMKRRLQYMKAFGLTTLQTYCPWHLHEPEKGEFCFDGIADLKGFLSLADEMGFKVMLRPAPYICSECDCGGLPYWLLKENNIALRTRDEVYLKHVAEYYDRLCKEFVPFLSTNGGPIIAVAVENEYGSYGSDKVYLEALAKMLVDRGVDVPLYTTDGTLLRMLGNGSIDGIWEGVNYRYESYEAIPISRKFQPDKVPYVGEYWSGRAGYWGENFKRREIPEVVQGFKEALEMGATFNFYMFNGGTNFGFTNGSHRLVAYYAPEGTPIKFMSILTSYDTDALLNEQGEPTKKYFACRKALYKYLGEPEPPMPDTGYEVQTIEPINLTKACSLWDYAEKAPVTHSIKPLSFEQLNQAYGFVLYRTTVMSYGEKMTLTLPELRDRADVYINGKLYGTMMRERDDCTKIDIDLPKGEFKLEILVENLGRIFYGPLIHQHKGLIGGAVIDSAMLLTEWDCISLPFKNLDDVDYDDIKTYKGPQLLKGEFKAKPGADAFLDMRNFKKGFVFVNGFNLGRYWNIGPQYTLYVPGDLLKENNTVEVFELYCAPKSKQIKTSPKHIIAKEAKAQS